MLNNKKGVIKVTPTLTVLGCECPKRFSIKRVDEKGEYYYCLMCKERSEYEKVSQRANFWKRLRKG